MVTITQPIISAKEGTIHHFRLSIMCDQEGGSDYCLSMGKPAKTLCQLSDATTVQLLESTEGEQSAFDLPFTSKVRQVSQRHELGVVDATTVCPSKLFFQAAYSVARALAPGAENSATYPSPLPSGLKASTTHTLSWRDCFSSYLISLHSSFTIRLP